MGNLIYLHLKVFYTTVCIKLNASTSQEYTDINRPAKFCVLWPTVWEQFFNLSAICSSQQYASRLSGG